MGNMKMTLTVEGMNCAHCEAAVSSALSALAGVKSVKANSKKSSVVVAHDGTLDVEQARVAVEDAGFTFVASR